jgi:pyruvate dehydrogenase E2 component (dihydrolipoamide acetyltransferase)
MATLVFMPQLGVSEESALLAQWHVAKGDTVSVNQLIFTLETDKSVFDVESETQGVVLALLCEEGEEVRVADPVCVIGRPGEDWKLPEKVSEKQDIQKTAATRYPFSVPVLPLPAQEKIRGISPRARAVAERMGIESHNAVPTGPGGRVIERDIRALSCESGAAAADFSDLQQKNTDPSEIQDVPHSRIRKAIAVNMLSSLQNLAQLTHHHSFDATALINLRKRCKQSDRAVCRDISIGDLVLFAAAHTLLSRPEMNAHYCDDFLRLFRHVHLGVAVDTPRGLMVPTIFNAELLSVSELTQRGRKAAADCRKGSVDPSLLKGATFTVSNLGAAGVEMFTPIINPPQVGILGVCNITYRLKADGSVYPAMGLSFTYDHRAVDGAPASRFMQDLCGNLEGIERLCLI